MAIPEDIEDLLNAAPKHEVPAKESAHSADIEAAPSAELRFDHPSSRKSAGGEDTEFLKKKVAQLTSENSALKHEVAVLKGKLDQIRKIA